MTAADYRGRVVLVDLWATWCRPCEASMPFYAELHQRYADRGFSVVAVSVDEHEEDVGRFLASRSLPFPILRDPKGTVPALIDLKTMPSSVLLDRDGRVLDVHAGFADEDRTEIEARVWRALETATASAASTARP